MKTAFFTAIVVSGSLVALGGAAEAASLASGKKIEVKVHPKTSAEERTALWKKFGGWCAISDWHPAIAKCEESKEGDATFRTLTLKDGGKIKEKLLNQTDLSYSYAIVESPLPVKNYEAQFSIVPDDDDEDEVNVAWSATYDAEGKPDKEARAIIDGIFKDGLESIKAKLAHSSDDEEKPDDDDDNDKGQE
jgi:hypothetical protein